MTEATMTNEVVEKTGVDRKVPDQTVGNVDVDEPRMTSRAVDVYYGD
jgi:hypothetical protein